MTTGALIRNSRLQAGLTQAELARRAGTSQPVISELEHDRRDPTTGTLRRVVEATGHRLRLDATRLDSDLPPPRSTLESAQRLVDVLLLADAIPAEPPPFSAPRLVS